jgi:hypothetical protein
MGVGAVFISTLAVTKLPEPTSPPETQEALLTLTLQPIVSFIILGSILVRKSSFQYACSEDFSPILDGLSIPLFTLSHRIGTHMLSVRQTLSSMPVPDWLYNVRRADDPPVSKANDVETGKGASVHTLTMVNECIEGGLASVEDLASIAAPTLVVNDTYNIYEGATPKEKPSTVSVNLFDADNLLTARQSTLNIANTHMNELGSVEGVQTSQVVRSPVEPVMGHLSPVSRSRTGGGENNIRSWSPTLAPGSRT